MSAKENIETVRRVFGAFNTGNLAEADTAFDPNYADHSTFRPPVPGVQGFKQRMAGFRQSFPDIHFVIDEIFTDESGDKVTFRWTMTGTDTGGALGRPPSGKAVKVTGINIEHMRDGRIVEHFSAPDNLGLMQQLGIIPAPGQGGR